MLQKDIETRLIKALIKKNREIDYLKIKNALYSMFLTPEQKQASDMYAEQCSKRGDDR